jgi:hypothetical protein
MSVYIILFGILTYYVIPMSILKGNTGLFFAVLNGVLISSVIGMVFIMAIVLPIMQRFVLWLILICKPSDKPIGVIVRRRLESSKDRNSKISLLITCLLGFLVVIQCAIMSNFEYFKKLWRWYRGGDLIIHAYYMDNGYLNEIPMTRIL